MTVPQPSPLPRTLILQMPFILRLAVVSILAAILLLRPVTATAVPSFAGQTGQPCAACHVGAFGPQLTKFGRDFKLNGYTATDNKNHGLPLAVTTQLSFTHTNNDQPGPAAPHFASNNNFAMDQASVYYAGKIAGGFGAFIQLTYDGVADQGHVDNVDIRYAHDTDLFDEDLVYGFTANNSPSVSDLWNSTPVWAFPYNSSPLAPTPLAATLIDGGLGQRVAGAGGYAMWNSLIYAEFDLYRGLGYDVLNATGIVPVANTDKTLGVIPYWRLALQKDFGRHYIEVGTYGLNGNVAPGGIELPGQADQFTDLALDANYQFYVNPRNVTSDVVSAHATLIHEDGWLGASRTISGSLPYHGLNTFRADVSYSLGATVTPSIQYFQTNGTGDPAYWATPNGSPNTSGMIAEIAYVPWGKPDSFISWGNVRLAVQYVSYFRFDGVTNNAAANNALYFSIWAAARF